MRLIDADKLCLKLSSEIDSFIDIRELLDKIDNQKTIDAAPVVHARWIHPEPGDGDGGPYCSNCKKYSPPWTPYYGFSDSDYCPCCGSKMDAMEN